MTIFKSGESAEQPRYSRMYVFWSLVWALSFIGVRYLVSQDLIDGDVAGVLAGLVPSFAALVAAWVFFKYLECADELQRLIQLKALAAAIACGAIAWPSFTLMDDLFNFEQSLSAFLPALIALVYVGAVFLGWRKYQ